jgi:hypothetical protein
MPDLDAEDVSNHQRELRIAHAKAFALTINISPEHRERRNPLSDVELALLHGPMDGPGAVGPRAHAEILRLRAIVERISK